MRIRATFLCLWMLAAVSIFSASSSANPDTSSNADSLAIELIKDLEALFVLQDATARGHRDAAILQKPLLRSIGDKLTRSDIPNAHQIAPFVAAYVLSGGDPETATRLAKAEGLLPVHRQLLEGVALFMQGNRENAETQLRTIDFSILPRRISGRVALAQSLLERDAILRQSRLSAAMALMPGTLVEESALRRSALAFAESADEKHFWGRLARYQRRYPNSLYAQTFWEEIMSQLSSWTLRGRRPDFNQLDHVIMAMPASRRRHLYLSLARQSVRSNDIVLVQFSAARAGRLAVEGSTEAQAARLYRSLFAIVSDNGEQSFSELKSLKRDLLNSEERALLDAGLWIAQQIAQPAASGRSGAAGDLPQPSELQKRGQEVMTDAERLLAEAGS